MYCDLRVGGTERWFLDRPDDYMQIPDAVRKCVAFLGCRKSDGEVVIGGTVFFAGRRAGDTGRAFTYAVTAAHCLLEIDKLKTQAVLLRVNLKDGSCRWLETDIRSWLLHPTDNSVDVAVLRIPLPPEADHFVFPIEGFADAKFYSEQSIGVGDEVFFPGLFKPHKGETRNIPIVRIGTIAAMPEDFVSTQLGNMKAFLIECRSIGGLSGSPVFAWLGLHRYIGGKVQMHQGNPQRTFRLIGIMHGHFGLSDADSRERLNMGIAIVNTQDKILEVLEQPFIMEKEREALEKLKKETMPTMDVEFDAADSSVFTKEDFENALKRVSRRIQPSPPDEGKSGT